MNPDVEYVILTSSEDLERAVDLEIAIWGGSARDAVPSHMMRAVVHNDGVVIGARRSDGALIGFTFGFAVQRDRVRILWSHAAGVLPNYQGQGVGEGLKLKQRQWAREHGFSAVRWTFDPLQRGNANFNIARLGAVIDRYHNDFYGTMTDSINAGLPSDRVEANWSTYYEKPKVSPFPVEARFILQADSAQQPRLDLSVRPSVMLTEIPERIDAIKAADPDLALRWRLALRDAMHYAIANGYQASDFIVTGEQHGARRWAYVFSHSETVKK